MYLRIVVIDNLDMYAVPSLLVHRWFAARGKAGQKEGFLTMAGLPGGTRGVVVFLVVLSVRRCSVGMSGGG